MSKIKVDPEPIEWMGCKIKMAAQIELMGRGGKEAVKVPKESLERLFNEIMEDLEHRLCDKPLEPQESFDFDSKGLD